jgi:hypothetical protein
MWDAYLNPISAFNTIALIQINEKKLKDGNREHLLPFHSVSICSHFSAFVFFIKFNKTRVVALAAINHVDLNLLVKSKIKTRTMGTNVGTFRPPPRLS